MKSHGGRRRGDYRNMVQGDEELKEADGSPREEPGHRDSMARAEPVSQACGTGACASPRLPAWFFSLLATSAFFPLSAPEQRL